MLCYVKTFPSPHSPHHLQSAQRKQDHTGYLHLHTNQIIAQLLDRVRCDTGLDCFRVMRDKEGLEGFDDDDSFFAL